MTKHVLYGKESRDKILEGVKKITDAVRVTMGAMGKCVMIGNAVYQDGFMVHLPTLITKDGYTVTKHFELADSVQNRGAMLIKEAAMKTVEQAGDATTCTCVLAESLISNGMKLIDEGANSQELKKGMDKALVYVIEELKKISTPVRGNLERIEQIATVSANNDAAIGKLIADAYSKIGDDGVIDIEAGKGIETEIKVSEGFKFDRGWVSPYFINNRAKEVCEFENPLILLYDKKVTHHSQIEHALKLAMAKAKPLMIICDDADEAGLAYLAMNNMQGRIKVCVVKSPEFGTSRNDYMEDIALMTGGIYVSDIRGVNIKDVTEKHFGTARKVVVSRTETIIVEGAGTKEAIAKFVDELKANLANAKTEDEKYPIEKRIARLSGGVATIIVGAATETELNEKLDRVDDAVRATKAAISEGFVAGGGTAFLRISLPIMVGYKDGDKMEGIDLVFRSLKQPLSQICENAGVNVGEILEKVSRETSNVGYNALTGGITDMVEAGIIDSTKALRCALTNAVSVAGMVLTSECSMIANY